MNSQSDFRTDLDLDADTGIVLHSANFASWMPTALLYFLDFSQVAS